MTRVPSASDLAQVHQVPKWSRTSPQWTEWPGDRPSTIRAIIDNDFAGDPDDLFHIVHHLLSPSIDIRAVVCSYHRPDKGRHPGTAKDALLVAQDVFARMGLTDVHLLHQGADAPLPGAQAPQSSDAVRVILEEAARDEPDRPLFYLSGAGLTDLASAYLHDPSISERITVVWIGGLQHDDVVGTRGQFDSEYNLDLDRVAAQIVFSAGFEIWQVPRNVYRTCILSEAELRLRVAQDGGPLGRYLYEEIRHVLNELAPRIGRVEAYTMGDQPLVLLSVLQGVRDPADDFTSSAYVTKPAPRITDAGTYAPQEGATPMRVYTQLDHRLMFEDFFVKLREFAAWQQAEGAGPC